MHIEHWSICGCAAYFETVLCKVIIILSLKKNNIINQLCRPNETPIARMERKKQMKKKGISAPLKCKRVLLLSGVPRGRGTMGGGGGEDKWMKREKNERQGQEMTGWLNSSVWIFAALSSLRLNTNYPQQLLNVLAKTNYGDVVHV